MKAEEDLGSDTVSRQIRGSAVLLAGRVLALLIGVGTQVLLVRGLSREGYGAFAYALAIASSARLVVSFGDQQAFTRFVTIYDEQGDRPKLFGTYVMVIAKIVATSVVLIGGLFLAEGWLTGRVIDDPDAISLLLVLVFLAPLDALVRVFEGSFAVFSRPRAIFVRKYVVEPGLRFLVVLGLVLLGHDAAFVAVGYVLASVAGLVLYAVTFLGVLRTRGLLGGFDRRQLEYPAREYFGFSLPLVTTEVVDLTFQGVTAVLLGWHGGATEVAGFKAVLPVARLNAVVIYTFTLLFTPLAARYFTRRDRAGMKEAYWRTAAWLAVGTFPMGVATVALADPITTTMFGERYADAGPYLAVLGGGFYVNAALGFNALTLQTWGRVRWVVCVNLGSALLNVALSVLLVPAHGAIGAAIAISTTLVVQNVLNQVGLGRGFGVGTFDASYARLYGTITVAFVAVVAIQALLDPPLVVGLAIVAVATTVVVATCRVCLAVDETFPELARIPLVGRLLSG